MKAYDLRRTWVVGIAALMASGFAAMAQLGGSLTVENQVALRDAGGRLLPGNFGFSNTAARVDIRKTSALGEIVPPDPGTGEGDEGQNPLARQTYVGANVLGTNSGRFSETFNQRLGLGDYYARAYDRPTAGESLYYLDSAPFQDDGTSQQVYPSFAASVWKLVATGQADLDSDGDGIPDEMENEVLGTNPANADSDGDGFGDAFEVAHSDYMNPMEGDPPFVVQMNAPVLEVPEEGGPHTVSWMPVPVPGLQYRLEYVASLPFAADFVETVWSGTSTNAEFVVDVDEWVAQEGVGAGFFRVWALPAGSP